MADPRRLIVVAFASLLAAACEQDFASRLSCSLEEPCPPGASCVDGVCIACPDCAEGEICLQAQCFPTRCEARLCASGEGCVEGGCVAERCVGVGCGTGQGCAGGACLPLNCPHADCPAGALCHEGACTPPSCVGMRCAPGEVCAQGTCLPTSCAASACAAGAACVEGRCQPLACVGMDCPPGTACALGRCVPLECGATPCPDGEACVDGACVDPACAGLTCPSGTACEDGACSACALGETSCEDGIDGDCDGLFDCADPDCLDRACGAEGSCSVQLCAPGGTCEVSAKPVDTVCRAAAGDCDLEERCDGASPTCPDDQLAPAARECRPRAGPCDAAESCTGASVDCPSDAAQTPCTPAALTLSDAPAFDFGVLALGGRAAHDFTVTNAGGWTAVLGEVSDAGLRLAAPFALAGGTCASGGALPPSASCTISVEFSALAPGTSAGEVRLAFFDGAADQTVAASLSGSGPAPGALAVSDAPAYDFGTLPVGTSASRTFTVTNGGGVSVTLGTVDSAALGLAAPFALTGGTCATGGAVAPLGSCTLIVGFTPSASGGASDTLALSYQDGASPQTLSLALTGTGVDTALLTVSDGPVHDFGTVTVGAGATKTFTVTNGGGLPATLGAVSSAGLGLAAPFALSGGSCATGGAVAPLASCTLTVEFAPSAAESASDTLELGYDDGASPRIASRALAGAGADPALLTISDGPIFDFGGVIVGATSSKTFTVSNTGGTAAALATVSSAGLGLAAPFALTGGTCASGASIAPLDSCTLTVEFTPSAPGPASDALELGYDDGAASRVTSRAISAVAGAPAVLAISDGPAHDFGTVVIGTSGAKTFAVSNTGGIPATLATVSTAALGLAAPFALTGGTCASGASVAPLGSCTLVVGFTPTASGPAADAIDLGYHDGAQPQTASRALSGAGITPALLTFSDEPAYDFGTVTVGTASPYTFTVTNSGGLPARLGTVTSSGLGLAAPFARTGGTCATALSVPALGSCTIAVTFAPTSSGPASDSVDLAYDDGAAQRTAARAVSGTGFQTTYAGFTGQVRAVAVLPDQRRVVAGDFSQVAGSYLGYAGRINPDGSLDTRFGPKGGGGLNGVVQDLALDEAGRIVVAGDFTQYGTTQRGRIARLNADGSLDTTFAPPGTGFNSAVSAIALDASGRIVAVGSFTSFNGTPRGRIARLNADGTLDTSFAPAGFDMQASAVAIDSLQRIVVAGSFTTFNSVPQARIARLDEDGILDVSFASAVPGLDGAASALTIDSAGRILVGGAFTSYGGQPRGRLARFAADGTLDATFAPTGSGFNSDVRAIVEDASGRILATGYFTMFNGASRARIARLSPSGSLDTSFATSGLDSNISTLAVDASGRIVVGGSFTASSSTPRAYLARLAPDGALDGTFAQTGTGLSAPVYALALDASGRVVVGGSFTMYSGTRLSNLALLLPDGRADPSFVQTGSGFNGGTSLYAAAVDSAGRILVGGTFSYYGYAARKSPLRFNPDGSLDASFTQTGTGVNNVVYGLAVDASDRVLVAGPFTAYDVTPRRYVARFNTDGTLDTTFNTVGTGFSGWPTVVALDGSGRIVLCGAFTSYDGTPRSWIARLAADGSLDTTFAQAGTGLSAPVNAVAFDSQGRLVVGGSFTTYSGTSRPYVARLNEDGSLDTSFAQVGTGLNGAVQAVSIDASGGIVVGGSFTRYGTTARPYLARLNADGSLDTSFAPVSTGLDNVARALAHDAAGKVILGGQFTSYDGTLAPYYYEL